MKKLIFFLFFFPIFNFANANNIYSTITALQADSLIKANSSNPDFIIIDVRTSSEFNNGRISNNAINIDYNGADFNNQISALDKTKLYLIYCGSGTRSGGALIKMEALQFQTVYNLQYGVSGWKTAGLPLVTGATGIEHFSDKNRFFNIYPNPATNYIYIEQINPSSELTELIIYTIKGELKMSSSVIQKKNLDISDLPNGNYIILLKSASGNECRQITKIKK